MTGLQHTISTYCPVGSWDSVRIASLFRGIEGSRVVFEHYGDLELSHVGLSVMCVGLEGGGLTGGKVPVERTMRKHVFLDDELSTDSCPWIL